MKITDLLAEINIEVHRLIAVNTDSKVTSKNDGSEQQLKKLKSMFYAMKDRAGKLEKQLGFFDRRELNRDLRYLLNILQSSRTNDEWKIFESSNYLSKLCTKYAADYEHDEPKKLDVNRILAEQQESYNPGFQERINNAFNIAREKREKHGIQVDTPVTTLNVSDVKEYAERAARIESVIAKKKAEEQERIDRAARIRASIDKRRAEQKSTHSISSFEGTKYKSIMEKRIKELLQDLDDEQVENKKDMVSIRYEFQNNTYYIDGEAVLKQPKRLITEKEKEAYIKSKLKNKSEFGFLFDKYIPSERAILKDCDPYIIEILLSKDIRLAKDYIQQIQGSGAKKLSTMDFKVVYDVRGLESSKGVNISSKERRSIRKAAKQQNSVATVLEDKRRIPWYAAIPFVGALALAGIAGITAGNNTNNNNEKESFPSNVYTDTIEPGTTTETTATAVTNNPGYEYTTDLDTGTTYEVTSVTTNTTETTTAAVTTKDDYTHTTPSIDDNIKVPNNNENQNIDEESTSVGDTNKEQKIIVNIGDKISVKDGLKYTADCLGGGNSNRIGAVSWRPATDYNIERVAFVYQGRVLKIMNHGDIDIEQTLKDVAYQNGINIEDINPSVLLSLAPGTADTGWANISIEDMKKNISKSVEMQSDMISHVDIDFDR